MKRPAEADTKIPVLAHGPAEKAASSAISGDAPKKSPKIASMLTWRRSVPLGMPHVMT
jgi:hypothetical protein